MQPVVRVSIMRCAPDHFTKFHRMMMESDAVLRSGIEAMPGLISFYTGGDEEASSLAQVSLWKTLPDAKQLDTYQPMLDLAKFFIQEGATFERPTMNYVTLWQVLGSEAGAKA